MSGHPTGAPALDEKYYYTCFSKAGSNGFAKNVPLAVDRRFSQLEEMKQGGFMLWQMIEGI